jgi:hypothetical protein
LKNIIPWTSQKFFLGAVIFLQIIFFPTVKAQSRPPTSPPQSVETVPKKSKSPLRVRKANQPVPDPGPVSTAQGPSGAPIGEPNTAPPESAALISISRERMTKWGALALVGAELRGERDVNDNYAGITFANLALGGRYQQWFFLVEEAQQSQSTGNATLSVKKEVQDILGWVNWTTDSSWHHLAPLLGAGLGAYQIKVTTTLAGTATKDTTPWKLLGGVSAGLRLDLPVLWLSVEARLLAGDDLDPQPTLGGLARIGLWF